MKTSRFLAVSTFALAMSVAPSRAADPQTLPPELQALMGQLSKAAANPQATTLSPELQALVSQLLQAVAAAQAESATQAEPAPVPAATTATPSAPAAAPKSGPLVTSSLNTGHLNTSSLAASGPLGGRGTAGGTPRLNDEDWRLLFPTKPLRQ